jgi:DNA adenine methylase
MSIDIKSPLIYPGSKGSVLHELLPLITEVEFKEYRELFLGSASIYLAVRQQCGGSDCGKRYWINDLNLELYNFWKMMQIDTDGVITKVLEFKNDKRFDGRGKELFYHLKRNLGTFKSEDKRIDLAAAYYILNRSAFSGGSLVSGFSQDHYDYITDERIKDLKKLEKLLMKNDVRITHLDYQKIVETLPMTDNSSEDIIIMNDPPYWLATESGLYGQGGKKWDNTHKSFDHLRFAKVMKECKYRFLITYDDSQYIRNLFKWANQKSWIMTHKMRKDKIGRELLISNFTLKDIRKTKQLTMTDY